MSDLRVIFSDGEFVTCKDCYLWAVAAIRWASDNTSDIRQNAVEMCEDGRSHCDIHPVSFGHWDD